MLTTYECSAETPSANSAAKYSKSTQTYIKAREEAKRQLTNYDIAVQRLTNLITNSFGVFKTEEVQEDGSVIFYLHNKPTLAASSTIWKMTADAFAVSTDYGKNYDAGFDASGNAVFNVLNAIGINADWIDTGDLTIGGKQKNIDGKIRVYDADGNIVLDASKDKFTVSTPKFDIDDDGNVFLNSPYIQKAMYMNITDILTGVSNYKKVIGQAMVSGAYYPRLEDDWYFNKLYGGQLIFDLGDAYGASMTGNEFSIKPLATTGAYFKTNANGTEISGPLTLSEGTDAFGWSLSSSWSGDGTARIQSGKFVTIYGTFVLKANLAADGRTEVVEGIIPAAYRPKWETVRSIVSVGGSEMVFYITTGGNIRVRNLSKGVISASTTEISFRLDYFR